MADIDRFVERLDNLENVVAYTRRAPGIAALVGFFVFAGTLHVMAALGLFLGAGAAFFDPFGWIRTTFAPGVSEGVLTGWITAGGFLLLVVGVLDFIVAWALWDLRSWAWGLAMTLSIIELLVIPWGLALGVVRIVYLTLRDVRATYAEERASLRAVVRARRAY